jgi:actin-related protein
MTDQVQTESQEVVPVEYTDIEKQALDQGWRPKDEYEGDPGKWVDASIFVARAPLFEHIDAQKRELKEVKKALKLMASHHAKTREVEYARALDELRAQKKTALTDMDADAVINIDERIDLVKEQIKQDKQQVFQEASQEIEAQHPEFVRWTDRNSWYGTNRTMKAFADAYGNELAAEGKTPPDVLRLVEKEVRSKFPEKFSNPNREKASSVESSSSPKASGGNGGFQLSAEERRAMATFVRAGALTEEQYIKEIKLQRGVQ